MLISEFSNKIPATVEWTRRYADLGIIPSTKDDNGRRLFSEGSLPAAREARRAALAARGIVVADSASR